MKSLGLKGLGLKLGVEKSGVEMSFNHYKDAVVDGVKLGRQFAAAAIDFVNSKINP